MVPPHGQFQEEEITFPQVPSTQVEPKPWIRFLKLLRGAKLKPDRLLLGSALLCAVGLALTQTQIEPPPSRGLDPNQFCQKIVQPEAAVTREQLAQLLTVPERGERAKVQNIVKQPYCQMPSLSIRAGAMTERYAYPLASDPQTWVVILYEGKTYVGYGFKRA